MANEDKRGENGLNRIIGFVVFFVGIAILWEGRHLSKGGFSSPGPGLFPALLATILIILSFFLIIPKGKKEGEGNPFPALAILLRRLLPVYAALIAYFLLLEYLGFVVAGMLLMFFLFVKVGHLRWHTALLSGLISIGAAYLVFVVLLKGNFPKGMLGF